VRDALRDGIRRYNATARGAPTRIAPRPSICRTVLDDANETTDKR
jgi:hypothetical protein